MKRRDAQGYITAETAVVLPALVLVLCVMVWAVGVMTAQLRCVDAARAGARALARGEPADAGRAAASAAAPEGARVSMSRTGALVQVRVSATIHAPPPADSLLPGIGVDGHAVATAEDRDAG